MAKPARPTWLAGLARLACLACLACLPWTVGACGDDDDATDRQRCEVELAPRAEGPRILFLGNSLTYWYDIPGILAGLLEDADVPFYRIDTIAGPNLGLQDHWENLQTRAVIEQGWDLVVMQQGPSATEGRPSLLAYAELLAGEVRAAGGEPALFMVWPARQRLEDLDAVSDAYAAAAELVDGWLFPGGEAWRSAWARDGDLALYDVDGFHPSLLGSYLVALVIFEQVSGRDPATLSGRFCAPGTGIATYSAEMQTRLAAAASEANERFAREH